MAQGKTGYVDFTKTNYSFPWVLRINWSETYDVSANTSNVTITSVQMQGNWSGRTYNGDMLIKINGSTAITLNLNSLNNGVYNAGQDRFNTIVNDPGAQNPTTITGSVNNIAHNSDGTLNAVFSIEKLNLDYPTLYSAYGSATFNAGSVSTPLTTIPRASTFSTNGSTIGSAMSFTITRASSSFTHTLQYRYGTSGSFTNIATGVSTSYSWTIPASLGSSIPTAMSGTWQFKCITYNGSTNIGEATKSVTLYIPSDSAPTCTTGWAVASLDNTGTSAAGKSTYYVGISKVKATFDTSKITPRYGATANVKNVSATYNGTTITSTGYLGTIQATSISVTMTASDSRGKTTTATATLTAVQYFTPYLSDLTVFRCTQGGTASDDGAYCSVKAKAHYVTTGTTLSMTAAIKPSSGSFGTATSISDNTASVIGGSLVPTTSYVVRFTISDGVGGTATTDVTLPTAFATFNLKEGGHGAAFGKYAEMDNALDIGDWNAVGRVYGLGRARDAIPENGDFNSYVEPGVYAVEQDVIMDTLYNKPNTGIAGLLIVSNGTGRQYDPTQTAYTYYLTQKYIEYQGREWTRRAHRANNSSTWTWYAWRDDSAAYPREEYVSITGKSTSMRIYKMGRIVVFDSPEDITSLTGGAVTQIGTLPSSEWYPARTYRFPISNSNAMMFVQFDTDGKIYAYSTSTISQASNFSFNGCYITT